MPREEFLRKMASMHAQILVQQVKDDVMPFRRLRFAQLVEEPREAAYEDAKVCIAQGWLEESERLAYVDAYVEALNQALHGKD